MPRLATTTIEGASGRSYAFNVYPRHTAFNDFIPVVYLIARRVAASDGFVEETPIYIGETDHVRIALEKHEQEGRFEAHGYNAVYFHRNASVEIRRKIQADLIEALRPPCVD